MSPVEWYYAQGDKQQGPVSPAEVKSLADAGKLLPDDLVWREGMEEWIPARKVKGLFDADEAAAAKAAPPVASPPRPGVQAPAAPVFEKSPAAFQRAREGPARHLFDFVLEFARSQFTGHFVESTAKMFTAVGHYGLYAAMLVLLVLASLLAVKLNALDPVLLGLGGVVLLYVLQYTASRFCRALVRLNQGSPAQITSTAFLDCVALLGLALGVTILIWAAVQAIRLNDFLMILSGLAGFILCEYAAFVSLNPDLLKISVAPEIRAGEEAIGVLSFLLKLGLLMAPVAFGVGVATGTIRLLHCFYLVFRDDGPPVALIVAGLSVNSIVFYAALPLLAYCAFLLYYLLVDVIRATLSLPGKLDKLAAQGDENKDEG
jgi:hypothetical protein